MVDIHRSISLFSFYPDYLHRRCKMKCTQNWYNTWLCTSGFRNLGIINFSFISTPSFDGGKSSKKTWCHHFDDHPFWNFLILYNYAITLCLIINGMYETLQLNYMILRRHYVNSILISEMFPCSAQMYCPWKFG